MSFSRFDILDFTSSDTPETSLTSTSSAKANQSHQMCLVRRASNSASILSLSNAMLICIRTYVFRVEPYLALDTGSVDLSPSCLGIHLIVRSVNTLIVIHLHRRCRTTVETYPCLIFSFHTRDRPFASFCHRAIERTQTGNYIHGIHIHTLALFLPGSFKYLYFLCGFIIIQIPFLNNNKACLSASSSRHDYSPHCRSCPMQGRRIVSYHCIKCENSCARVCKTSSFSLPMQITKEPDSPF